MQIGTPTGRLACHDPNLQQIPKSLDYRGCFVAPPGKKLIIADYSQIEMRILADMAGDKVLIDAFRSGADLHKVTASQMYGIAWESVTTELRSAAKAINYGLVYGMGAQGLAARTGRTVAEAEQLINRYFATFSGVARWLKSAGDRAIVEQEIRTKLGRVIYFNFNKNSPAEVAAIIRGYGKNGPIQGTSSEITKLAMVMLQRPLAESSAQLVNSIHDELVVEVDDDKVTPLAKQMEAAMITAGNEIIPTVPVTVDLKIADSWVK
jgi:DNA polymerase-1